MPKKSKRTYHAVRGTKKNPRGVVPHTTSTTPKQSRAKARAGGEKGTIFIKMT